MSEFVYFFGSGPNIKIGYTTDWRGRLRTLSTAQAHHIAPVVVIPGDRRLEAALHQKFAHLRLHGEWFELGSEIVAYLAEIADQRVDSRSMR